MADLSRVGERDKLKPRNGNELHWHRLGQGVYIGYRPSRKKAGGLPILTVAQLSGTSVAMIEKHYGHLVRDDAEEALASIAI